MVRPLGTTASRVSPAANTPACPSERELSTATVLAGCGGGAAIAARLPQLIEHSHRLVLDADALNAIATSGDLQQALCQRATRGLATLITPHPLEAARLLGSSAAEVQTDRLAAVRALVERLGCAVVLKGSGSVVMAPGLTPHINASGNAALSTPGSGDVLAGWLAGWWSQTGRSNDRGPTARAATPLPSSSPTAAPDAAVVAEPRELPTDTPAWATDTLAAATYAVWSHGRAAELASPRGLALPAGELVTVLGSGLRAGLF
jgi:NAD(P)H-hydrate repair Nnr-like enzyme with NAD(P)H-hydrate dehydratase domain